MMTKKYLLSVVFLLSVLSTAACGQFSIGIVTQAPDNETGELMEVTQLEPGSLVIEEATSLPDPLPTETPVPSADGFPSLAYIGYDGNIWLLESGSDSPRQITTDASPFDGQNNVIEYGSPQLSSDGLFLAYFRQEGVPAEFGFEIKQSTQVLNLENNQLHNVLDGWLSGKSWKPGTHILAYGVGVNEEYFMSPGDPETGLANGIMAMDFDSGEQIELVSPERGYALSTPTWSPDGRYLGFSELSSMEGSGKFAYYDFENQAYVALDEALGFVSWFPDGRGISYAKHTYVATGEERLYLRFLDTGEQPVGPDYDGPAYATYPVISPDGSQIAYLAYPDGPETWTASVMVLNIATQDALPYGDFEDVWELNWAPDGSQLIFSFGNWGARQIMAVDIADGSQKILAEGSQPALAGK